jgi:hypothetical protein
VTKCSPKESAAQNIIKQLLAIHFYLFINTSIKISVKLYMHLDPFLSKKFLLEVMCVSRGCVKDPGRKAVYKCSGYWEGG